MKQEFKFKTNINCGGCVSRVTPFLNKVEGIDSWKVDTSDENKILTVQSNGATPEDIIKAVEKPGFEIQSL